MLVTALLLLALVAIVALPLVRDVRLAHCAGLGCPHRVVAWRPFRVRWCRHCRETRQLAHAPDPRTVVTPTRGTW